MRKNLLFAFLTIFILISCHKDNDDSCIGELIKRLDKIETIIITLEQKINEGVLIKSVTPIAGGWRIEFTGGEPSTIDILNGEKGEKGDPGEQGEPGKPGTPGDPGNGTSGTMPKIEVIYNEDGSISLSIEQGSDTKEVELVPAPGVDGVAPKIEVRENDNGTITIWYNVTRGYPDSGWIDTGVNLQGSGPFMINNEAAGTVTVVLVDGMNVSSYTFEKASVATRFEIMTDIPVEIPLGSSGDVVFRVNPSTAWVPTGLGDEISKWELDQIGTRASYVTPSTNFSLQSIMPDGDKQGQYIAKIRNESGVVGTDYIMALVLNVNTTADIIYVSTGPFTLTAVAAVATPPLPTPPAAGDMSTVTDGGVTPTEFAYVGAFWRYNQTGERVIRMNVGNDATNFGPWTAEVAWYDSKWEPTGNDGVVLAAGGSPDPYIYTLNAHDAEAYQVPGTLASVGGTVVENGDIIFRIGLTRTFAVYNEESNPARYAVVILTYGSPEKKQKLFLRQGEGADYLMNNDDADAAGSVDRTGAVKFSAYNLTAAGMNDSQISVPLATGGGSFVDYPTKAGALFQFASQANQRNAYHPALNPLVPVSGWDANSTGTWGAEHETCPPGYRRPTSGATRKTSDMAQSLMPALSGTGGTDYSVWGYYADGFFDRRQITTQPSNWVAIPADRPSAVAPGTKDVAYMGRLFYNPTAGSTHENASLFFPASATRDISDGTLYNAGNNGHYWSAFATSTAMARALSISIAPPAGLAPALEKSRAYSVRCVKEP